VAGHRRDISSTFCGNNPPQEKDFVRDSPDMRSAVLFGFALAAAVAVSSGRTLWHQLNENYTFDRYCAEFGRNYEVGSSEYTTRKSLFEANLARILKHNADKTKTWKVGFLEDFRVNFGLGGRHLVLPL
jgi:hypothetical protein